LAALGYIAIGLDHFALPSDALARAADTGRLRRSFQGYVEAGGETVIGLGPSAISTLPQGYAQNIAEPGAWTRAISAGRLATARGHALTPADRPRARFIEQIMCEFAGDLRALGGAAACAPELALLAPMLADGLVWLDGDHLRLSPEARPFCRLVGAAFDLYARTQDARHAVAV
jgi:oxygen-independent coproporphyrinogen-3 oxidase